MTGKLPINIDQLLRQHHIEGERIEYKAGWNPQSVWQNGSPESIFDNDENQTWFLVRLPVHERAFLVAIEQDTGQDKSLINKKKGQHTLQDTLQDTPQDTPHETKHETIHVTEHIERLISILTVEMNCPQQQNILGISNRSHFVQAYLGPALKAGLIEMNLPDKPTSRYQRYRRTAGGEAMAVRLKTRDAST